MKKLMLVSIVFFGSSLAYKKYEEVRCNNLTTDLAKARSTFLAQRFKELCEYNQELCLQQIQEELLYYLELDRQTLEKEGCL